MKNNLNENSNKKFRRNNSDFTSLYQRKYIKVYIYILLYIKRSQYISYKISMKAILIAALFLICEAGAIDDIIELPQFSATQDNPYQFSHDINKIYKQSHLQPKNTKNEIMLYNSACRTDYLQYKQFVNLYYYHIIVIFLIHQILKLFYTKHLIRQLRYKKMSATSACFCWINQIILSMRVAIFLARGDILLVNIGNLLNIIIVIQTILIIYYFPITNKKVFESLILIILSVIFFGFYIVGTQNNTTQFLQFNLIVWICSPIFQYRFQRSQKIKEWNYFVIFIYILNLTINLFFILIDNPALSPQISSRSFYKCGLFMQIVHINFSSVLQLNLGVMRKVYTIKYWLRRVYLFYSGSNKHEDVCAVCLSPVIYSPIESLKLLIARKQAEVMLTCCDHIYHSLCLKYWGQIRTTCPIDNQLIDI